MSEHTPEPWAIFDMGLQSDFQPVAHIGQNDANEDLWIGQGHTQIHGGGPDEDARRIVACVNACRGLDTEKLEHMAEVKSDLLEKSTFIVEALDDYRAMVAELVAILKNEEWTPWDGTDSPVWCRYCHGNVRTGHKADCVKMSAITKAEGRS